MNANLNWFQRYELAKSFQAEVLNRVCRNAEFKEAVQAVCSARREERRFFWRYQLRSLLYRLAPRLADRLVQ